MKIAIVERPGKCRWCGCTERRACGAGCSWANARGTLCSECVPVDTMIRTAAGRKQLAAAAATYDAEALAEPIDVTRRGDSSRRRRPGAPRRRRFKARDRIS